MGAYDPHAILKQCAGCGRTFATHYHDKMYHSPQCRDSSAKRRARQASKTERTDTRDIRDWHQGAIQGEHIAATDPELIDDRTFLESIAHLPENERAERYRLHKEQQQTEGKDSPSSVIREFYPPMSAEEKYELHESAFLDSVKSLPPDERVIRTQEFYLKNPKPAPKSPEALIDELQKEDEKQMTGQVKEN